MKVVVFTGGTGGTKLVQGLQRVLPPEDLTVVVNTGDDIEWWGLHVSPDIDSVLYGLAGLLSVERGWGVNGDSFRCLERMNRLGEPAWFSLGDLDLATHLTRTSLLRDGLTLTETTAELAQRMGIGVRALPMSDDRVSTMLETSNGRLSFQEYFVRERHSVEVSRVEFVGAEQSRPAPGLLEALAAADVIVFAPSNPVTSIGPILAVPGIRESLRNAEAPVVAVSPIIGHAAVSGPAAELMRMQGWPSSVAGIAQAYEDFLNVLVIDTADMEPAKGLSSDRLTVVCTYALMRSLEDQVHLARVCLDSSVRDKHQRGARFSHAGAKRDAEMPSSQERAARDDN